MAKESIPLQDFVVLVRLLLVAHVLIRFGGKATCTTCRVIDRLTDLRIDNLYDKANDRTRRIELASQSVFLPKFPQQVFVDMRHSVNIVRVSEVDAINNL